MDLTGFFQIEIHILIIYLNLLFILAFISCLISGNKMNFILSIPYEITVIIFWGGGGLVMWRIQFCFLENLIFSFLQKKEGACHLAFIGFSGNH